MPPVDPPAPPKPLAALDSDGQPTKLSYNVPDPTSYPGRAFISLDLRPDWFKPSVVDAAAPPVPTPVARLESGSAEDGFDVVTEDGVFRIPAEGGVVDDADLRPADRSMLEAIEQVGREPRFYRTLFGDLALAPALAPGLDSGERPTPNVPETEAVVWLTVDSPAPGTVQQQGAVTLLIKGRAGISHGTGAVAKVEVKVGDSAFKPATSQDGWANWSYTETFASSRTVEIAVQALSTTDDFPTRRTFTLNIVVLPGAPPADKVPPTVKVAQPKEAEIIPVSRPDGTATVVVKGSAADDKGVAGVTVRTADGAYSKNATPKSAGDWSEWSAELVLPEGTHRLVAQCADTSTPANIATANAEITVSARPKASALYTRLMLVEQYRLSNFLGSFGAGRTLKTFTLLPGEKTRLRLSTYRRSEKTAKSASSILDSFTSESAREFQKSVEREQQYKQNFHESFDYNVSGSAQATWAWGSAAVEGGVSGGTNGTREEFAKNITSALEKHAAKASAKREVQIETSLEEKMSEGEESSIEREIENINLSRTLNFVFRGLNQQFWSILHLVDVRVAFARAYVDQNNQRRLEYREVTLSQLDSLLRDVIVESRRQDVHEAVISQLKNIADYKDVRRDLVELAAAKDDQGAAIPGTSYLRVRRQTSTFEDAKTGFKTEVDGVILRATDVVMRTDGVIVEAVLGQGEALDSYSKRLQDEAARAQQLANQEVVYGIEREKLGLEIVRTRNVEMARIYEQIFENGQVPPVQPIALATNGDEQDPSTR